MVKFIDENRDAYGVGPICDVLPIASSRYYEVKARQRDPELRPAREKRDEQLRPETRRVWIDVFSRCIVGWRVSRSLRSDITLDALEQALWARPCGSGLVHHSDRLGPWRGHEAVELATLAWVDWFNNKRLLEPIGHVPPTERESAYYRVSSNQPWWLDSCN